MTPTFQTGFRAGRSCPTRSL